MVRRFFVSWGSGLTVAAWFKADSFPGKYQDPRIISEALGAGATTIFS